ncbi:MAG: hypothetical protein ACTHWW_08780 [Arthrobacter sp.]|uniref:hypothetical protein n=1 Tax=unclassified Arthrobacter TaxID=235627 RepID=UPI002651E4BF|nr:hypothetical protein [Micrococcaceae bacterium]MDN5811552.1 hypothetical protein [Micrococcaceae bacterium]MDN5823589.1 hypothetical protein [Micrococcaceae bacterium]MDN5878333.1 hypothetical protein [Micrococcaceae bacterium]MDN5887132.1 hypothetical protein [Micrococcaceae bacterium]
MDTPEDGPDTDTTGDAVVDAQLESLKAVDGLPAEDHEAVYSKLHEALQRTLDEDPSEA